MSFLDNIKDKMGEWKQKREESAEFKRYVDEETKPIRRAAYLEERKKQALEEGKIIAKKEFTKLNPSGEPKKDNPFGLPDVSKFINTEPMFKDNQPIKLKENNKNGK